jgi:hypothetical protein
MGILDKIVNSIRGTGITRAGANIHLNQYRRPWHHYWASNAGNGWIVLGSSNRRKTVDVQIPYLFPSKPVARSVAKFMTRSAMVRTHIIHNETSR